MPGAAYKTEAQAVSAAERYGERTEFALRTNKSGDLPVFPEAGVFKGKSVGGFSTTWHDHYIRRVEQDHWQCYDEAGQPLGIPHMWYINAVEALDTYAKTLEPGKLGPAAVAAMPKTSQVRRTGDHDPDAYIRLTREDDGDIIAEILAKDWHGDSEHSIVQFCTHQGGGRSPHTLKALAALMVAIEKDNEENKQ